MAAEGKPDGVGVGVVLVDDGEVVVGLGVTVAVVVVVTVAVVVACGIVQLIEKLVPSYDGDAHDALTTGVSALAAREPEWATPRLTPVATRATTAAAAPYLIKLR